MKQTREAVHAVKQSIFLRCLWFNAKINEMGIISPSFTWLSLKIGGYFMKQNLDVLKFSGTYIKKFLKIRINLGFSSQTTDLEEKHTTFKFFFLSLALSPCVCVYLFFYISLCLYLPHLCISLLLSSSICLLRSLCLCFSLSPFFFISACFPPSMCLSVSLFLCLLPSTSMFFLSLSFSLSLHVSLSPSLVLLSLSLSFPLFISIWRMYDKSSHELS